MSHEAQRYFMVFSFALATLGMALFGKGAYIHVKARLAQSLLQSAWEQTLASGQATQPWPWADTWPVARLIVPGKSIDLIVLAGDSGRVLAFGPGHHFGSAAPGAAGTALFSAHRDTHFGFLKALRPSDLIEVQNMAGAWTHFRVLDTQVVDARQAVLPDAEHTALLVLATCYPFDTLIPGGPLRYLVTAQSHLSPAGESYD